MTVQSLQSVYSNKEVEIKQIVLEVICFDTRKLFLPLLVVMLLFSGVYVLEDMRSQEVFERTTEKNMDVLMNSTITHTETTFFNDSIDYTRKERTESWNLKDNAWANYRENQKFKYYLGTTSTAAIYKTPLYPIAPEGISLSSLAGSSYSKYSIFGPRDGYVLLEAPINHLVKLAYIQNKHAQLVDQINRSPGNWTLEEYRERAYEIRDADVTDPEVREYVLDNSENNTVYRPLSEGNNELAERAVNGELKEVGPIHFIPAAIIAFFWTYLISGVAVVGIRGVKKKLRKLK